MTMDMEAPSTMQVYTQLATLKDRVLMGNVFAPVDILIMELISNVCLVLSWSATAQSAHFPPTAVS